MEKQGDLPPRNPLHDLAEEVEGVALLAAFLRGERLVPRNLGHSQVVDLGLAKGGEGHILAGL
jgi:hypothetical protein